MAASDDRIRLDRIIDDLPIDFAVLRAEARAENRNMVERLASDWVSGANRFDRRGEALIAAHVDGDLAGIGGMTLEPALPDAMRMRRFYVRPAFRLHGIGRKLALALMQDPRRTVSLITVNAGAGSAPFWESLGFLPDMRDGHTHVLYCDMIRG